MADLSFPLTGERPAWRSPREIVEDVRRRIEDMALAYAGSGREPKTSGDFTRCQVCRGLGYTGTGDSDSDRCTAFGCRYGYIRHEDVRACPICRGDEVISNGRESVRCSCVGEGRINFQRALDCGVPGHYANMVPETWKGMFFPRGGQHVVAYEAARDIALDIPRSEPGLFLSGAPGLGKTTLAAALVVSAFSHGKRPVWIGWPNFCDRLAEAASGDEGRSGRAEISRASRAQILVIDDLGSDELYTPFRIRSLHGILDARRGLPTVITSMQRLDQIADNYGEHIASRIADSCRLIRLEGADQRIINAKARADARK